MNNPTYGANDFFSVQSDCIRDHIPYIRSYVKHHINEVEKNYSDGIVRHREMKRLMRDLTIHDPRLMSIVLNSGDVRNYSIDLANLVGGEEKKTIEIDKIIKAVGDIVDRIKTVDTNGLANITSTLLGKLNNIETELKNISLNQRDIGDEKVINNLNTVITSLSRFDDDKKSYTQHQSPVKLYQVVPKDSSGDSESFNNILKRIIGEILQSVDASLKLDDTTIIDTSMIDTSIIDSTLIDKINKIIDTRAAREKINIDRIKGIYARSLQNLELPIKQLSELNDKLDASTKQIESSLYGIDDKERYSEIKSYVLPKFRDIVIIMDNYDKDNDFARQFKSIFKQFNNIDGFNQAIDQIFTELDGYRNNRNTLKEFINLCDTHGINEKIAQYNEKKINNSIIEHYNKNANTREWKDYIDKLNIYMAQTYAGIINESKGNASFKRYHEINKKISIIRKVNVKMVRDNKTSDRSNNQGIATFIDSAYNNFGTNNLQQLKKKLTESEITDIDSARGFIHAYNRAINNDNTLNLASYGLPQSIHIIPYNYFIGDYTERIYNNIFSGTASQKLTSADQLNNMINIVKGDQRVSGEYLYEPNFDEIKKIMKKQSGGSGGSGGSSDLDSIQSIIEDLMQKKSHYESLKDQHKINRDKYILAYSDAYAYTRYLIIIATNQIFTDNYVVYNYLNKGLIELYKRILNEIVNKLDSGDVEPHIVFIKKYYYVVVKRLNIFLNQLSTYVSEPTDIIDIRNIDRSSIDVRNNMILFNYFKSILESYNEMFQNKITIYARLNDMTSEIDYGSKIFVSDHEMVDAIGCGYNSNLSNTLMTEQSIKQNCANPIINSGGMRGDSSVMWMRNDLCAHVVPPSSGDKSAIVPIKFTEVFDSVNFPENGDISKYMTLETRLAKKKSVCLMTYGYSGTGKTYTLFGSGQNNNNKPGMLQSTLDNINGLYKVKFRLFEIYGLGLPYDFYWNDVDQDKSRMDDIYHFMIHYNLDREPSDCFKVIQGFDDLVKIEPKDFGDYIKDDQKILKSKYGDKIIDTSYVTVTGSKIKEIFKKFDTFTGEIDRYRKGEIHKNENDISDRYAFKKIRRIRETLNNPESSRSVLIYDFKLYVGDESNQNEPEKDEKNAVKFLIIDLPGREEIKETYIDPYFSPIIENILNNVPSPQKAKRSASPSEVKEHLNETFVVAKMIITCMALNPMALAVFYPIDILGIIKAKVADEFYTKLLANDINTKRAETSETSAPKPNKLNEFINFNKKSATNLTLKNYNDWPISETKDAKGESVHIGALGYRTEFQYMGMCAIFAIYELILSNRFDVLIDIYKSIVEKYIDQRIDQYIKNQNYDGRKKLLKDIIDSQFRGDTVINVVNENILDKKYKTVEEIEKNIDADYWFNDQVMENILKKVLKYDYLSTPLEGIYINENIMGLIKYLATNMASNNISSPLSQLEILDEKKTKQKIMKLEEQRNIARCWLMSPKQNGIDGMKNKIINILGTDAKEYEGSKIDNLGGNDFYNNVYSSLYILDESVSRNATTRLYTDNTIKLNLEQVKKQQEYLLTQTYKSDKLFNFQKPIINDILDPYIEKTINESDEESIKTKKIEHNLTAIKDYKMFYLFANYDNQTKTQKKCPHQIKLLNNTKKFVETLAQ